MQVLYPAKGERMETNKIIHGNSLEEMRNFPSDIIDLTITSPPYNLEIPYENQKDNKTLEDYLSFSKKWMSELFRISKKDGRFCLNIPLDTNKNGKKSLYADFVNLAREVGWKYHTTIVWNEQNISRRTAWGSWKSASAPYVTAPVEMIVVLYKNVWKKQKKGISTISRDDFLEWTLGVWTFSGEKKKRVGGHPAAFPEELPKRCIELFSYENDLIFDPFVGSGTTCVVAKKLERKYLGIELAKSYYEFAIERLNQ